MTPMLEGADPASLTIGVQEQFLLIDPDTGVNRPVADEVAEALPEGLRGPGLRGPGLRGPGLRGPGLRGPGRPGFRPSVVEMTTTGCTTLTELSAQLTGLRRVAAEAAEKTGAWLVAVGATPIGDHDPAVAAKPRYGAMAEKYGTVVREPAVGSLHVHVRVPDRELAVQVCNHLQVWLPAIRALTGNSPLFEGVDTGHASWRSVQLLRWPTLGPTPRFPSAADYDRTVADLIAAGVLLDDTMVSWYARLSPAFTGVEVRVNDVCTEVADTVLAAALIRAAVATAITDIRDGHPAPWVRNCVTAAAHWRAARDGLTHTLIDLRLNQVRPAWDLINEFFATVSPALLFAGDLELVVEGLARLRRSGDGATRQRKTYHRTDDIYAVVADLAVRTTAG